MNKFVILGPPGSGKSTQAMMLAKNCGFVRISVGDIFRWNIQNHTKLGARIHRFISVGLLAPDNIVEEVIRERLQQHDWNYGFVLDGYPATAAQTEFLLESYDVDGVILLRVSNDRLAARIGEARACQTCGFDSQLIYDGAHSECDLCGATLSAQPGVRDELVAQRLREYQEKTEQAIHLFRQRELLVTIDGSLDADEIHDRIRAELGLSSEALKAKFSTNVAEQGEALE